MAITLTKLDKRMKGYGHFIYVADYSYKKDGTLSFLEVRRWCTQQFGESVELDAWEDYPALRNPKWSWERGEFNRNYRCRIFLATEKEAEWFSLRWS